MALSDDRIDELSREMVKGKKSVNWLASKIEAEVRKDALEEAAAVAEQATYRKRWVTAGINGQAGKVPPCYVAAAIRARGKQ